MKLYVASISDDVPYFAMELPSGETLEDLIAREALLSVDLCLQVARGIAEGVAYLHATGTVHRDIKPSNLMLTRQNGVKLLDFGLARLLEAEGRITLPGMLVGTADYLAPELYLDVPPSPGSDLWAVGAVIFRMLTGRHHLAPEGRRITPEDRIAPTLTPPARWNGFVTPELSWLEGSCARLSLAPPGDTHPLAPSMT